MAPVFMGTALFGLSDILGNRIENAFATEPVSLNPCRTIGAMAAAPFTNGAVVWFYRLVDHVVGQESRLFVRQVLPKVGMMMVVWTPISIVGYLYVSTYFHLRAEQAWHFGYMHWRAPRYKSCNDTGENNRQLIRASFLSDVDLNNLRRTVARETTDDLGHVDDPDCGEAALFNMLTHRLACAVAWRKVEENFWQTYLASYLLWPVSDVLNFTVIQRTFSPHFRATWDAFVGLNWYTYMSIVAFRTNESFGALFEMQTSKAVGMTGLMNSTSDVVAKTLSTCV